MTALSDSQRERVTVALAQIATCPGQLTHNLQAHLWALEQAKKAKAELVIFPELSLSGYLLGHGVLELAMDLEDPRLGPLREASRDTAILVGLPLREASGGIANAAVLFDGGQVVGVHRKLYLPTYGMFDEGRYFVPGRSVAPLPWPRAHIGVLICEDAWHPTTASILVQRGAELLVMVAGGPSEIGGDDIPQGLKRWHWIVGATAITTVTPTFFANRCGWEEGILFSGGSWAVDGRGRTLGGPAPACDPAVIVAEVDLAAARRHRTLSPIPQAERWELWQAEVERNRDELTRS
ncbi:Glutamine-dependent NAD(+) synthetase [bacterium HR09]|nr:Glutamine-dependent NAD(+) synthetase [bacterium HR09]